MIPVTAGFPRAPRPGQATRAPSTALYTRAPRTEHRAPHSLRDQVRLRTRGITLIELIVAIALLAILTGVVGLAITRAPSVASADDISARISDARTDAITRGQPVTITISSSGLPRSVTALPDGSVLSDSGTLTDRLTGRAPRASH